MKVVSLTVALIVLLNFSCEQERQQNRYLENKEVKRDELVFKLVSTSKVTDESKVLSDIGADKEETVEILTKPYLKDGKYQTLVKIKFEEQKFSEVKRRLETQENIEETYENYIYEGSPFDMEEETLEDAEAAIEVEFDAAHHQLIHTEQALAYARGEGVVVAVTDTGVEFSHKDLKDNIWHNSSENPSALLDLSACMDGEDDDSNGRVDDCLGWNFAEENNDPAPKGYSQYHGSHVSGIIASMENGEGSVGVAPDAKIMSIRFFGKNRWTSTSVLNSYVYAVDNGAKIINTSFNVDRFVGDEIYLSALDYANDHDVIVVNSAGNNGKINPPRATLSNLLFVANTAVETNNTKADKKVKSSNFGHGIDISAPGYKIYSTAVKNTYKYATGTSMSAPVVAGALALVWSKHPEWSKEKVISRLISTADNIDAANPAFYHKKLGSGRLNLERALSDEKQDPISVLGFSEELKTVSNKFKIHFKGLADWSSLTDDTIEVHKLGDNLDLNNPDYEDLIKNNATKIPTIILNREKLSYGTNEITVSSTSGVFEQATYLVKINDSLTDHFANSLDGNSDKIQTTDDHFYKIVKVVKKDHIGPILNKIELVSESLVTPSSANIKFRLDVSDDFSGYKKVSLEFRNSEDFRETYQARCALECLNSDGQVEIEVPVSEFKTNGIHYIRYIALVDKAGKSANYYVRGPKDKIYSMPLHATKTIELKNTFFKLEGFDDADTVDPKLLSDPMVMGDVKVGSSFDVQLKIKEDGSGLSRLRAIFTRIDGKESIRSKKLTITSPAAVDQKVAFNLSEDQAEGTYYLRYILIEDEKVNRVQYYCKLPSKKYEKTDIECPVIKIKKDQTKVSSI